MGMALVVGSPFEYGVTKAAKTVGTSIALWKIIFLGRGLGTVVLGLWFYWVIPDSQLNARWLSERDQVLAVERVRSNQQGIGNKQFKMYQFKEAMTDPMTWAFVFFSTVNSIPSGKLAKSAFTPASSLISNCAIFCRRHYCILYPNRERSQCFARIQFSYD